MTTNNYYLILSNVVQSTPNLELLLVIDCEDGDKLSVLKLHVWALDLSPWQLNIYQSETSIESIDQSEASTESIDQ